MLLGVLLLMIPESACIPVPSEVTLMAAGFGVHEGAVGLPAAVAAATLGNLIGSLIAYGAGRFLTLPSAAARRSDALFERHGSSAVFIGRLLPLVRSFISVPAGHARVPVPLFVVLTVAGCAIWSVAFVLAGAWTGAAWHAVAGTVGHVMLALGILTLLWLAARRPLRG
jgi:membrane protein DedA with SNARE-associated domain